MKYIYISIFFILNLFISNNVIADQSVIKELQKGGKIVFIRHSLAPGNGDPDNFDLKNNIIVILSIILGLLLIVYSTSAVVPSIFILSLFATMPIIVSMHEATDVATRSLGANASPLPLLSIGASLTITSPD